MQNRTRDTAKKGVGQKSLPMASNDDHIATFFIRRIQDFLRDDREGNLGYK